MMNLTQRFGGVTWSTCTSNTIIRQIRIIQCTQLTNRRNNRTEIEQRLWPKQSGTDPGSENPEAWEDRNFWWWATGGFVEQRPSKQNPRRWSSSQRSTSRAYRFRSANSTTQSPNPGTTPTLRTVRLVLATNPILKWVAHLWRWCLSGPKTRPSRLGNEATAFFSDLNFGFLFVVVSLSFSPWLYPWTNEFKWLGGFACVSTGNHWGHVELWQMAMSMKNHYKIIYGGFKIALDHFVVTCCRLVGRGSSVQKKG